MSLLCCLGSTKTAPIDSVNIAISDGTNDVDGAWAIFEVSESDNDIPDLVSVSEDDSEVEEDLPDVLSSGWLSEDDDGVSMDDFATLAWACSVDSAVDEENPKDGELAAGVTIGAAKPRTALLDSGSTCHISPYCDQFAAAAAAMSVGVGGRWAMGDRWQAAGDGSGGSCSGLR